MVCDACNGVGYTIDDDGRKDVCDACLGLGYVKEVYRKKPLTDSKAKIKKAFIYTFVALFIFYGVFLYGLIMYSYGPVTTLLILLVGHMIAVTFLVSYVLFRAVHDGQ